jgi:hypothetical protein
MINKLTLALLAAAVAVGLTSQAFAQSATAYGDVRAYHYDSEGSRKYGSWGPEQQGSRNAGQAQAASSSTQNAQRARGA